jgi:nucleoside-diphosphate-sugar epimerase
MSDNKNVFIIGPGFIGWNVLDILASEGYAVTGFVRRKEHGDDIKVSGATKVVLGDLDDKKLITEQTVQHGIIFHTATADHLPSVEAVLDGVRQRLKEGKETIFVHTSGTSVLEDTSMVDQIVGFRRAYM